MKKSLIAMGAALACLGTAHAESSVQLMGLMDAYAGSMRMAGDPDRTSVVGSGEGSALSPLPRVSANTSRPITTTMATTMMISRVRLGFGAVAA